MNFSAQKDRSRFIKKIIFWSILVGGLIAMLFIPTRAMAFDAINSTIPVIADAKPVNVCEKVGGCLAGSENVGSGRDGVTKVVLDVARWLIYISVGIAVLYIVFGAFRMITGGNEDSFKSGKTMVINATIGLILAIVSLTIVNIIAQAVPTLDIFKT